MLKQKAILMPVAIEHEAEGDLEEHALEAVYDLAQGLNASVVLLHVENLVIAGASAGMDMSGNIYQAANIVMQNRIKRGKEHLAILKKRLEEKGILVRAYVLKSEDPMAQVICQAAKDESAGMIVVATHAYKGIKHVLKGSVAEQVVHASEIPVLVVY